MHRSATGIHSTEKKEALARYVKAVSYPVRINILMFLDKNAFCFTGQLTEEILLAPSTISQQLKELKEARFINGDVMPHKLNSTANKKTGRRSQNASAYFLNRKTRQL